MTDTDAVVKSIEDMKIVFICRNCGVHFAEQIIDIIRLWELEYLAPNLCTDCAEARLNEATAFIRLKNAARLSSRRPEEN